MKNFKILFLLVLLAVPVCAAKIENGEQLIAAMHKKYAGKWYKTLTFVQKNTEFHPDRTTENSKWYEAMSAPGKLRIDFDPIEKGNGALLTDAMQHSFKDGKLMRSQPFVNPLQVLGFDVYIQPVEKTIAQLKDFKIDLATLREDVWQNRPVYVVGAKQGDSRSPQFWVDKKNLYFVRVIEPIGKNKDHIQEIQFNKYQKVQSGGWISPEVVVFVDGKKSWMEEYSDIQINTSLSNDLFDPQSWMTADRKYFQKK